MYECYTVAGKIFPSDCFCTVESVKARLSRCFDIYVRLSSIRNSTCLFVFDKIYLAWTGNMILNRFSVDK